MTRKKRIVALYEVYQPKWDLFPNCCNDELAQLKKKVLKQINVHYILTKQT